MSNETKTRKIVTPRNVIIASFVIAIAASFTILATPEIGLIPLASLAGGIYLSKRSRSLYIGLVLWLFFLAPMMRRLVDFHTGGSNANMIIASPILACIGALPRLRRLWAMVGIPRLKWLTLIASTYAYAAFVGYMLHSPFSLLQETVTWVGPFVFALYVFDQRDHMQEIFRTFRDQFLYGTLVMGLYGIYQYAILTPWDATWMENSTLSTIGTPEPYGVRVFSTMNAPQTFADFILFGILLSSASTKRLRFVAIPVGLMALGLTNSRSAWVGGVVGLLFTVVFVTAKRRVQIVTALLGFAVLLALVFQIPQLNEQLTRRIQSFTDLKADSSVNERLVSQQHAITLFLDRAYGNGFGGASDDPGSSPTGGVATVQGVYVNDNGIEQFMLTFGWFGSVVFAVGLAGTVFVCLGRPMLPELVAINAALLSLLVQIPTMGLFASAPGFLLWSVMMLNLAYREHRSPGRDPGPPLPVVERQLQAV